MDERVFVSLVGLFCACVRSAGFQRDKKRKKKLYYAGVIPSVLSFFKGRKVIALMESDMLLQ